MIQMISELFAWVFLWPHIVWRVPAFILCALLAWGLWTWVLEVGCPWARLALRILGRTFERVASALEWIPRWSKRSARYVEHVMGVCDKADPYGRGCHVCGETAVAK